MLESSNDQNTQDGDRREMPGREIKIPSVSFAPPVKGGLQPQLPRDTLCRPPSGRQRLENAASAMEKGSPEFRPFSMKRKIFVALAAILIIALVFLAILIAIL